MYLNIFVRKQPRKEWMEHIFEESVSQIMVIEIVYKYKKDPELVLRF